ncbi:type VI secretion system baseplate subunit TssF/IglH [uncultured Shewanella sp.]|uniref:type VI secretion system baseplate subunit TssF/IglH n=1 Tax=uncultured Shewanella sp. TaxID=173975 RepID=UPI00261AFE74|nr:type VI secretion system baseplate subunit TssF/IglH [uncultured Shewanella sp.]
MKELKNEDEEIDLSEAHYNYLLNKLEDLSDKIKSEVKKNMAKEREHQLFRYNQSMLIFISKHILIKANYKMDRFSTDMVHTQKFQIFDIEKSKEFIYSLQSDVKLTSLELTDMKIDVDKYIVQLSPKKPVKIDRYNFDLWLNPVLWDKFNYKLLQLKKNLLLDPHIKIKIVYVNESIEYIDGKFEDIFYGLSVNENIRFKVVSPQFNLGLKVVFKKMPNNKDVNIKSIEISLSFFHFIKSGLSDLSIVKEKLFSTNIIPLFNMFDSYSTAHKLDDKIDSIPIVNPDNLDAKPISVLQVWLNNKLYEEYYNHITSEFFFHHKKQVLFYYPSDIASSIKRRKKIYVKALWTENSEHGSLINIKSNSFVTSEIRYDLITLQKEVSETNLLSIDIVVQIFRAFSDLDIRKTHSILIALEFLCGDEYAELYKKFRSEIDKVEYDANCNKLTFFIKNKSSIYFMEYMSDIISGFFYVNSPLAIKVDVFVR